jgi:hypothetical protein
MHTRGLHFHILLHECQVVSVAVFPRLKQTLMFARWSKATKKNATNTWDNYRQLTEVITFSLKEISYLFLHQTIIHENIGTRTTVP